MPVEQPRRFPPSWSVEETAPCFIVRDANEQALAFVYCEDEPDGRQPSCSRVTKPSTSPPTSPSCRSC
jgi:hypothetical protein